MRIPIRLCCVILFLSTSTVAEAQTSPAAQPSTPSTPASRAASAATASYDALMKQGEAALQAGAAGAETTAIGHFQRAAQAAPNDEKKFLALTRGAAVATQIKDYQTAINMYNAARALPKISGEQKAHAQFGYAASRHRDAKATSKPLNLVVPIQAEYEAALQMPQLDGRLQIQAHEAVGDLLILRGQRLQAIREYQKVLSLPGAKSDATQTFYLNRMVAELQKVAPSADALALAEAAYQKYAPLLKTPDMKVDVRNDFATIFLRQNQAPRAVALWNEIANEQSLPLAARVAAIRKISAAHRVAKDWNGALQAADRLSTLPGATPEQAQAIAAWRGWDRAGIFLAQGDEATARAEWQAMIAMPQVSNDDKGRAWMETAASYERELKSKPNDAALIATIKQAYDTVWKLEGAPPGIRAQALLNRGQMELNAKNTAAAMTILNDALKDVEAWQAQPDALADIRREFHLALAKIYRGEKDYGKALASLVQAQQFNPKNDPRIAQAAIGVSQDAFAAQQWEAARATLLALKDIWHFSQKTYLLNLAEIEIAQQKWADAKKVLDETATLAPTEQEQATIARLRAKIPAGS